ncbi:hypothetical protein EDB19DRAFT_1904770 [Suillus lakei]|nr:hypothetical protein EDB19DRAFT_1904770 [Suillus lakei]
MEKEWTMEGFYIAVRGDLEHYHEAKLFLTDKAKSLIKDVLHFEPKLLALKFESWVVGNFSTESAMSTSQRLPLSKLISLCRQNIQDGLDNILQKNKLASKKIPINYDNYEKRIVEIYAVAIDGWTYGKSVCNPGKIGRREHLISLLDALVTGKCSWIVLSEDALSEHITNNHKHQASGEQVYKARKATCRHKVDSAKSAQMISDSNLEDGKEESLEVSVDGGNTAQGDSSGMLRGPE